MELGLVIVLRALWLAAILPILIASIPSSKFDWFHTFLLRFARRGKIMQSSSHKLSVPQKFFCHFYVLASLWTALLLIAMWVYACMSTLMISEMSLFPSIVSELAGGSHNLSSHTSHSIKESGGILLSVFLLLLMETHLLRRLFESVYVFNYSPSARMHIFGYFSGLIFYAAAPLSLCCNYISEVFKFTLILFQEFILKEKDRMQETKFVLSGFVNPLSNLRWYTWIGAAIFFWGVIHQHTCHVILIKALGVGTKGKNKGWMQRIRNEVELRGSR